MGSFALCKEGNAPKLMLYTNFSMCEIIYETAKIDIFHKKKSNFGAKTVEGRNCKMKKIFGIMLSLLIALELCGMSIYAIENSYTDIKNHWAESSIKRWSEYDIVQGSNGEFEPNGQLTCAQLATILARLLKLPAAPDAGFTDNPSNAWYYDAINRCAAGGILKGNGDGTVTPNAPISRERAMVMLSRALGIEPLDSTNLSEFSDAVLVSPYAQGYITALIEAGIVGGVTANQLAPQEDIDRAATVTILDRAIGIYANENGEVIDGSNTTGIILIVAENVKITNAPTGVRAIVAEGMDYVTVNGVSVVGGSSYVVKEKESKPVSGGSGGSTSGGSSSGGNVPSPSYAISNLHFEQSGDDYVLAWNGTGRDSFYYNVYLKLSDDSDWSYKGVTQDAKFKMDMLHSSKGVKVEAYINETDEIPVAVAEDLSLEVNVTPVKSEPDSLSAIFTKEGNQYSATFTGLPAGKFAVVLFQKGDTVDSYGQIADKTGNVSFLIPSDENDLVENGTYTIYSYDNYVLNGNQLSYTIYQHCEPTYCIPRSYTLSNIRFEKAQNGDEYYLVWDSSVTDGVFYKLYTTNGGTTWSPQRYLYECKEKMQMLFSGNGFRVDLYKIGEDAEPITSAENLNISFDATKVSNNLNNLSVIFRENGNHYNAEFSGLLPETQFAMHINGTDSNHEMFLIDSDAQGNATLEINSGFNGLIESGKYTIYSFGNYALDADKNRLSYTVYQHCEPTPCITEGSYTCSALFAKRYGKEGIALSFPNGLPNETCCVSVSLKKNDQVWSLGLLNKPTDEVFYSFAQTSYWEEGNYSKLRVEAIDAGGKVLATMYDLDMSLAIKRGESKSHPTPIFTINENGKCYDMVVEGEDVAFQYAMFFSEDGQTIKAFSSYYAEGDTWVEKITPYIESGYYRIREVSDIVISDAQSASYTIADTTDWTQRSQISVALPTGFKLKEAGAAYGSLLALEATPPMAEECAKIDKVSVKTYKNENGHPFARTVAFHNFSTIAFPFIYDWLENDADTTIYVEVCAEPTAAAIDEGYCKNTAKFSVTMSTTGEPEMYTKNVVYEIQDDTLVLTNLERSTYYQLFVPNVDGDNTVMSTWSEADGRAVFNILNESIEASNFEYFKIAKMRVIQIDDRRVEIERHVYLNDFFIGAAGDKK